MSQTIVPHQDESVAITCRLINHKGIHARTAAKIVQCAQNFKAEIIVCFGETCVNGHSILGLMMLGLKRGDTFTLKATGPQAPEALSALGSLIENKFGEE